MMRTTTSILSIFIAVLLFMFFTHPEYQAAVAIKNEVAEYAKARETYDDFERQLAQKETQKANRSAYEVERLDRLVPESIDETQYLVDLEALAERHNLLFGNTSVEDNDFAVTGENTNSTRDSANELITVDISFEVVGTYEQFKSFLADLEKSITLFEVTQLSFSVVDGPFQQFSLTIRTFAFPKK